MQHELKSAGIFLRLLPPASGTVDFGVIGRIVAEAEASGAAAILISGGALEPLGVIAALAATTTRIGLVAEIDPEETHPYTAARRLAATDHVSGGRIGWALASHTDPARRQDYVTAVHALWDSWDDDVHRFDKAGGIYIDTAGIRAANHRGPFYRVAGPLDIPRPPQGWLPLTGASADADTDAGAVVVPWIDVVADLAHWNDIRAGLPDAGTGGQTGSLRVRMGLPVLAPHSSNRLAGAQQA